MTFDIINSLGRLLLTVVVIYKLTQFRDQANVVERAGLGLVGGGSFLTIAIIWEPDGPFSGWATSILTYGILLLLVGRTWRDRRHQLRNHEAVEKARTYLQARGKL